MLKTSKTISGIGSYGYRAQACNAGGCGRWSGTGSITVHLSPATPGKPSLSVTGPSYRPVVKVSWVAIAGATNYQVEETHPQDGVSLAYNGSGTSFSSLIYASGQVSYRMKACSSVGCSPYGTYAGVWLESSSELMRREAAEAAAQAAQDKETTP